jgi:hypothetical protein
MSSQKFNRILALISILLCSTILLFIAFSSVVDYGGNDSVFHYLHTIGALNHPELFIHHWGKPLFILLSLPFSYFGLIGVKVFNVLLMLSTAFLAHKISSKLKFKYSFLAIPLVVFAPVYMPFAQSALTEPLFAFVAVLGAFYFVNKKYILSAIIISFIIFARTEGISFLLAFGLAFLFKKELKAIPFLALGFIVYGFIGLGLTDNFLWFITDNPYTGAYDIYGSGTLTHYFERYEVITGVSLAIMIVFGFILWLLSLTRDAKVIFSSFSLIVLLPSSLYIAGHSYVWWKGLNGSLGLERVMGGITPLLAIVAVYGASKLIGFLLKLRLRNYILRVFVLLIPFLVVYETYSLYNGFVAVQPNDIDFLVNKSIDWLKENDLLDRKTYVYKPEYLAKYGADHFDKSNSRVVEGVPNRNEPYKGLKPGDIVVWEAHIGPNEGGLPLERLMKSPHFKLLKSFKPKHEIIVLGGYKYSIDIFERI